MIFAGVPAGLPSAIPCHFAGKHPQFRELPEKVEQQEEKAEQLELTQEMALLMRQRILPLQQGQDIHAAIGLLG